MSKSRTITWIVLIAAVAGAGYYGWVRYQAGQQAAANAQKVVRNAVQVSMAPVEKSDFPVYLTGLGTVQGFNTVLVRPRVDGQIDAQGTIRAQYAGTGCITNFVWQKKGQ